MIPLRTGTSNPHTFSSMARAVAVAIQVSIEV